MGPFLLYWDKNGLSPEKEKIMAKDTKTGLFLFHRAGTGEITQFIRETYPENIIPVMSLKKAIESGIISGNVALPPVYKAFFVESGPVEQHPQVAVLSNMDHKDFYEKFRQWYFGEGRSKWIDKQDTTIRYDKIQAFWLGRAKQMLILCIMAAMGIAWAAYLWHTENKIANLWLLGFYAVLFLTTAALGIMDYRAYARLKAKIQNAEPHTATITHVMELTSTLKGRHYIYTLQADGRGNFYILAPFGPEYITDSGNCKNVQVRYVNTGRLYFDFPRENV